MSERDTPSNPPYSKPTVGADFIIPALGTAFASYYLYTIVDLPWEARVNGLFICSGIYILSAIFFVRAFTQLAAGRTRFSLHQLVEPWTYNARRIGLLGLTVGFVLSMPFLGLTLTILMFMLAALLLLGERSWKKVAAVSITLSTANYLLFIALLKTRFPQGPIEKFLAGVF